MALSLSAEIAPLTQDTASPGGMFWVATARRALSERFLAFRSRVRRSGTRIFWVITRILPGGETRLVFSLPRAARSSLFRCLGGKGAMWYEPPVLSGNIR